MIETNTQRVEYLRHVIDLVDGIPSLIEQGRPDQVLLELQRIRGDVEAVRRSLVTQASALARELMG